MILTLCLFVCFWWRMKSVMVTIRCLIRLSVTERELQLSLLLEDFPPEFETLTPACWSLARIMALLMLLGSGEKSRSVSGSSLGRPLRPPRPRAPPRGAAMGALIGIRVMGGSGPPSSVMTSLGPARGPGSTGELEPGAWGPGLGPGLGPRKLEHKESQSVCGNNIISVIFTQICTCRGTAGLSSPWPSPSPANTVSQSLRYSDKSVH